ncbi:MAG TPA: HD domain-containing phosphohydrolase, partial [Candidatus Acidoferrales bacterium]|nr:HD domain-containing phosphohydrolase [Candidatus Acidoferrales bacterium]
PMKLAKEIWYLEKSPAARLAGKLGGGWTPRVFSARQLSKPRTLKESPPEETAVVCVVDLKQDDYESLLGAASGYPGMRVIALAGGGAEAEAVPDGEFFTVLPRRSTRAYLARAVAAAFENIELAARDRASREDLARAEREMDQLNQIGVALSAERDINRLLNLILQKAREVTSADAGSIYLVETASDKQQRLRIKLTQNDSRQFPFTEFTMPITETSMAGHVALKGDALTLADAYDIPPDRPYRFNPKYDQDSGYLTRSMLTLPMKNAKNEVIGVLQLINSKKDRNARLIERTDVEQYVVPFTERATRLALSLASQAAVAYENSKLYQDIETLFEGFVKAAVKAIEQRDPTTSGHSFRVSSLTCGLAEAVDRAGTGSYSGQHFSSEQMKEIRYAALLHDFGKVGVREEVLVKAKKLYPGQLELLSQRFDYIRKELEASYSKQKTQYLLERTREEAMALIGQSDDEFRQKLEEIDDQYQVILQSNEPTVLPAGKFDRLIEIARRTYRDPRGIEHNLLSPDEVRFLSIPKGSLDPTERLQIESHVMHTFNFLTQIPWTKEIGEIPMIARGHHEKLDGSGYPYQLHAEDIPVQTRMMTICDIFDALSASDRPYKKAVPAERAIDILKASSDHHELDTELFNLFVDAKIYELTVRRT